MTDRHEDDQVKSETGVATSAPVAPDPTPDEERGLSRRMDRFLGLAVLIAVLPLVVDLSSRSIPIFQLVTGLGAPDVAGTRIHLGLPLLVVLVVMSCLRSRPSLWRPLPIVVMLLVLQFAVSIGWGLLHGAGAVGALFFIQTIVPLAAWLAAYRVSPSPQMLGRAIMVGVLFTAVIALVFTAFHGGLGNTYSSSIALEDPIPQYRSYYPALMALGTAVAVASFSRDRVLSSVTLAACLLLIPITWSRAGIAMVAISFVATMFWCHLRSRGWRVYAVVGAATAAVFGLLGLVAITAGLWKQRVEGSDLNASDVERVRLAHESTTRLASNPFSGDSFRAYSQEQVGGGMASFERLFPSHNQFLDYGLRGGVLALVLLAAFFALTFWYLFREWRAKPPAEFEPLFGAGLGFLVALVPACLTELYISQTWTGVAIMFFFGALARMMATKQDRPTA